MKRRFPMLALGVLAVLAGTAGRSTAAKPPAPPCTASIGVMGGFTGARAAIGQEELNFSRLAVALFNQKNHTKIKLVEGDIQVDAGKAATVAQLFASNSKIVAVVGPDASFAVDSAGPIFTKAKIAFVSGSATRVSLTNGQYPTFFRVVPNDGVQGPTDARYMIQTLHAKKVMLVDNQTDYSTGLNSAIASVLQAAGVTVVNGSTTTTQTDFSSLVATIGSDVDVVFLPLEVPADAQLFANQLAQQGRHPVIFGGDSVFSPTDFHPEGAYVSSFAPDIHELPADAALVKAYKARYGDFATPFGPVVYAATDVILRAVQNACKTGKPTRASVIAAVHKTSIPNSILGGAFSFDSHGEPKNARFYVFKVVNGQYKLVTH
jgi:ABC-type branched-subunit amino acid transport system substrate-binding protein